MRARAVVYFSLESDRRPLLTQMLGAAIVQDLQTTVAALQGRPQPTLVVIDEFSAVAATQVVRLFGRARSAGFSLLLATQELSDLRLPGREKLLEQVMGNLSVLIAHRQVVPESAQLIASLAGRKGAWRTSHHSDGRLTRTRIREDVLDPGEIARLGTGWAAVIVLADGGTRALRARPLSRCVALSPSTEPAPGRLLRHRHGMEDQMVKASQSLPPERGAIIRWTACMGAVTAEALAHRHGISVASARARLLAAERARLLSRRRPLAEEPALYTATRAGLRACGLPGARSVSRDRVQRHARDRVRGRRRGARALLSGSSSAR